MTSKLYIQKNDVWVVSNPFTMETGNFLIPASQSEIMDYVTACKTRPSPIDPQEEAFSKLVLELTETDKSAYDNAKRENEFMQYLIKNPKSIIAQVFQEKLLEKYKIFKTNQKQIKKDRGKRKYQ